MTVADGSMKPQQASQFSRRAISAGEKFLALSDRPLEWQFADHWRAATRRIDMMPVRNMRSGIL